MLDRPTAKKFVEKELELTQTVKALLIQPRHDRGLGPLIAYPGHGRTIRRLDHFTGLGVDDGERHLQSGLVRHTGVCADVRVEIEDIDLGAALQQAISDARHMAIAASPQDKQTRRIHLLRPGVHPHLPARTDAHGSLKPRGSVSRRAKRDQPDSRYSDSTGCMCRCRWCLKARHSCLRLAPNPARSQRVRETDPGHPRDGSAPYERPTMSERYILYP